MLSVHESTYQRKIKSTADLQSIFGVPPRDRKVIMCHGAFDLVHPGHIRHLLFAKSKADILLVSLTCDAWIQKSDYRPFVPQELRAMNLAALEAVDYVLVDDHPTPIENIRALQPDYFAKGCEYGNGRIPPKTQEEIETLAEYGGAIVFTPGDLVLSSTRFIESRPPALGLEKLLALLDAEQLTFDDLRKSLDGFVEARIHVVGDSIVDTYLHCTPISTGSAKTPTMSVRHERQEDYAGGAAVVAKHLRSAGAQVDFTTVLGDDELGRFIQSDLERLGIAIHPTIDPSRPTTQKSVFIANGYRILKFDRVDNRPIGDSAIQSLKTSVRETETDGVIFSDFRHGIFSKSSIPVLADVIPGSALRIADSQVASRWGNILEFENFDLVTPNEREARFALGDQDSVVRPLALELMRRCKCKTMILKLGKHGALTYRRPAEDSTASFLLDSFTDEIVDPVGAGDALLAYATLSLVSQQGPVVASILGSIAAAIACGHDGNWQVTPDEVRRWIDDLERRSRYA